ncbi:Sporulation related domain-containing protein [Fontimonas thermophila]|uniref:Sporulation related domain-containing protein n=1 Tax=Fontimonas thermophila TaxID=1076937 RepID=A0A1I2IA43_9GAMM|nr:SPOR domain-containing protein [Fontimonas thermophila]SFF37726.1 Sporulation related domain-containing protein [Fontimonas thermophila]
MHKSFTLLLASVLALGAGRGISATPAGEVLLITGRGTATDPRAGTIRELAKGDAVHAGEIISSSTNSYINLKFVDGGHVLLRPNTRFMIEDYAQAPVGQPPATTTAAAAPPATASPPPSVGGDWSVIVETYATADEAQRIVRRMNARGLKAEAVAVRIRPGTTWHRVYVRELADRTAAEKLISDLKRTGFRKPSIVPGTTTTPTPPAPTVAQPAPTTPPAPETVPVATAPAEPAVSRAYFRLLRGGFRAVSGLIGKSDPQEYRVSTPVATIGIRGTDYLVILCDTACARDPVLSDALPAGSSAENGIVVGVIEGGVFVTSESGKTADVGAGQYLVTLPDGAQIYLPFEPRFLRIDPIPNPLTICAQE